jgi:uncharacterized DUF497 family protein
VESAAGWNIIDSQQRLLKANSIKRKIMALRFSWDPNKAEMNFKKHGVTFNEAATIFADPLAGIKDDPDHSDFEERFIMIGMSQKFRILVTVFTERYDIIRIISSRLATKKERKQYEERKV